MVDVSDRWFAKTGSSVHRERFKTRALTPADEARIRAIARQTEGFTVPSTYVIWMLSRTQENLCRVVSNGDNSLLGYCLALACSCREEAFLWQIGVSGGGLKTKIVVIQSLLDACVEQARRIGIRRGFFTALPVRISYLNRCLRGSGCSEACEVDSEHEAPLYVPTPGEKLYMTTLSDVVPISVGGQ
jgi:hypothetical protein